MSKYNQQQVKQLTRLIEVTRTNLSKPDRQKIMNMITIDAHSRDIVANLVEGDSDKQDCFLWMCQLRSYWDASISDCRIKICDASFPYGYEYLGNGPRLVITPLTDRIYITATQACWLCLGTAPAGPAGNYQLPNSDANACCHVKPPSPHCHNHARTSLKRFCSSKKQITSPVWGCQPICQLGVCHVCTPRCACRA